MTTYTAQERQSLVNTFKLVLKVLPDTNTSPTTSQYICDNISRVIFSHDAQWLAKDLIAERINYEFSLEGWLHRQSDEIAKAVKHDQAHNEGRKLQAYRKAWLRKLIKEFSPKRQRK